MTFQRFRLACLLLTLSSGGSFAATPIETADTLSGNFLAGRSAAQAKDSDAAAIYLEAAMVQDPGNPALVEQLFLMRLSNGNVTGAEQLAADVLKFNSQHRMARLVSGLKAFRDKNYEEARSNFAESAYTPLGELTSTMLTAWTYAGDGSLNAALRELDKLDSNENFANFKSFQSALIADYLKSSVRAEAAYKKAYAQAGTSLRVIQAYGNFLERSGKFDEAGKIYDTFLAKTNNYPLILKAKTELALKKSPAAYIADPDSGVGETLASLAAIMNDDQSIDIALLYSRLALEHGANQVVTQTMLGDVLSGMRRYEDSIIAYDAVPKESPLRSAADLEIAGNLQQLERNAEAETRLKDMLVRDPKNYDARVALGSLNRFNEKFDKAVEEYDAALKLLPAIGKDQWRIIYDRAICYERLGQWDKAEADFRKALELQPEEPNVLNYLGYSLIDKKLKLNEAITMVKKAVELKPNEGFFVDSLGWAYYQMADFEQALPHLERAVDLKPGDPIISEHLGDVYWRVGRKLEAKFQWQHAKDNKPEPKDLARIVDKITKGLPDLPPPVKPAEAGAPKANNG
jgi:tetratricopeptide (TPR) repeat protein